VYVALAGLRVPALSLPGGVDLGRLDLSLDWRVVGAAIGTTALTLATAALVPLLRFTRGVCEEASMRIARPDRVVRTLTALASFSYFAMWAGGALVLIALPLLKAFGGNGADFYYGLELPVTAPTLQTMVQTVWGPAPLIRRALRTNAPYATASSARNRRRVVTR
jgi:hypothetical protein